MQLRSAAAERFRAKVRNIMDARGISIADMARAIGSARPGISRILAGKEGVTLDRAERIADYLEVELSELVAAKEEKRNPKNPPRAA